MKETLDSLIYLVEEIERNENFKVEEIEGDMDCDISDDKSWQAEDQLYDEDLQYVSPFDSISAPIEVAKVFQSIESNNPEYFMKLINNLSPQQRNDLKKCFLYFQEKQN